MKVVIKNLDILFIAGVTTFILGTGFGFLICDAIRQQIA